ncbi:MAG: CCA tRNA nucleotidyltransferase [Candidatus Rhabdochlamydia sp.]
MNELKAAKQIVLTLQKRGYTAYFAGGWVRDLLMQKPSDDIDIATSASIQEIQSLFPKTIPVGINFGIVIVVMGGHQFEVATFRQDQEYLDGRRPVGFTLATPQEDAQRRDFTINGLFYDPITQEVFDFVGGTNDLQQGVIRAIGDPWIRFNEDKLRMIRAVRYAIRFHFPIDAQTQEAIKSLASTLFPSVAIERVWQEFQKMHLFSHFDQALLSLHELGLLPIIFPSLKDLTFQELKERVSLIPTFSLETPLIIKVLELFKNPSLKESMDLCDYFKLSKEDKSFVTFFITSTSFLSPFPLQNSVIEEVDWAHFYADPRSSLILSIISEKIDPKHKDDFFKRHANHQKTLSTCIRRIQDKNPLVKACDLKVKGISPGPEMGRLLKDAERIACNQLINDKDAIIDIILNINTK